jgi:hypothetical protein
MMTRHATPVDEEEHGDGFVDEEVMDENVHENDQPREPELEHVESAQEQHIDEDEQRRMDEAELNKILEEERMREVYGHGVPIVEEQEQERPRPSRRISSRASIDEDSLPELLLAAFKVAMRDSKNVAIVVLSFLVLVLALMPRAAVHNEPQILRASNVAEIIPDNTRQAVEIGREASQSVVEMAAGMPSKISEVVEEKPVLVIEKAQTVADVVEKNASKSAAKVEEVKAPAGVENIGKEAPAQLVNDDNLEAPAIETKGEAAIEETARKAPFEMERSSPAPIPEGDTDGEETS